MDSLIAAAIRNSNRSWWQCRYSDGRILNEWETLTSKPLLPIGPGTTSRWEEIPKQGMIGLRLLCPNGEAGELEAPEGHKFLQLKVGGVAVRLDGKGGGKFCDAHIIGVVIDDSGNCLCRAWETRERRLIEFKDNICNMRYHNIGRLALDVQGIK